VRPSRNHLPTPLRSTGIAPLPRYYGRSDSRADGSSAPLRTHERHRWLRAGLPDSRHKTFRPFRLHPPAAPPPSLSHATPQREGRPPNSAVPGFATRSQARREQLAVSSSSSCGLVIHLPLLPTPPRSGAVTFGYGPESVCPRRTSTSLILCAFGRTSAGVPPASHSSLVRVAGGTPALPSPPCPTHDFENLLAKWGATRSCYRLTLPILATSGRSPRR
jgi:hypothetical protein